MQKDSRSSEAMLKTGTITDSLQRPAADSSFITASVRFTGTFPSTFAGALPGELVQKAGREDSPGRLFSFS